MLLAIRSVANHLVSMIRASWWLHGMNNENILKLLAETNKLLIPVMSHSTLSSVIPPVRWLAKVLVDWISKAWAAECWMIENSLTSHYRQFVGFSLPTRESHSSGPRCSMTDNKVMEAKSTSHPQSWLCKQINKSRKPPPARPVSRGAECV